MTDWFSPFSQTIGKFLYDPVTNWQHFFNPQVIFNYNPQDQPVEAHVLAKVGSYGSQISTLIDVVDILQRELIQRLPPRADLTKADLKALKEFDRLRDVAKQAVDEFRGRITADDIVKAAKDLKEREPTKVEKLREDLDKALK